MSARLGPAKLDLLRRIYQAGKETPSVLPDWRELYDEDPGREFLDESYDDFKALGFLHSAGSGATFGGPFGLLSPQGRWFVEGLDDPQDPPRRAVGF